VQERELEEIMVRFLGREFDILLSTTIIESGLDIPSVNTIIINRADHLGLAQLYQLRGRVGRDRYQAYAYLLIPGEDITSEKAKKRLQAVKELSALGSSFQLASRDMEIRGAGNMLGHQQSGQQMSAVGFELYCNLLEESVRELKGEFFDGEEIEPEVLLEQEGYIPEEFIVNSNQRLDICKRLSDIKAPEDFRCIQEELEDRYGALPNALEIFLCLLEIKALARKLRIMKLEREKETVFLYFSPHVTLIPFERFEEEKENLTLMKEHVLCLKLEEDNILEQVKTALMGLMKYITI
jgi:transcription-repair coupling factor (superfamily II helicase)